MARGRVTCLWCKTRLVWQDGAWRQLTDGLTRCDASPDHKHRLAPA